MLPVVAAWVVPCGVYLVVGALVGYLWVALLFSWCSCLRLFDLFVTVLR